LDGVWCSTHGRDEKYINYFGWKPEGKIPLGRTRHRWEDNIGMDLKQTWWEGVDWIYVAQGRDQLLVFVNTVMKLPPSQKARNFLNTWVTIGFLRGTLLHGVGWLAGWLFGWLVGWTWMRRSKACWLLLC